MDSASTVNPSFSSTLLDEIYRSIDQQPTLCTDSIRKKQSKSGGTKSRNAYLDDVDDQRRACLMRKWMENKSREKPVVGRRSAADLESSSMRIERELFCLNSSSSSCDSCCGGIAGGGLSSSETESVYGVLVKPKPIRTGVHQRDEIKREKQRIVYGHEESQTKSKHEGKFVKTKSKALKIYSDLKKVKQPISPGGRLATFLNSLFTAGNNKKQNSSSTTTSAVDDDGGYTEAARSHLDRKSKSANASTCSSASSFSRSCLSNTPSSRGKPSNGIKRSVTFYPVSVLVDEDCQPCGHKSLHEEQTNLNSSKFARNSINKQVPLNSDDKNRHFSEAARNLLKNYQKKVECEFNSSRKNEYEDPFDDAGSDSSSDLFELDHLSAIGIDKYQEELPVYETTQLDTNRHLM